MRFLNYITEGRSVSVSYKVFANLIKTKYKMSAQAIIKNPNDVIYRGLSNSEKYLITDPTKGVPRTSSNTTNDYTLFVDNHPSWKSYPKRSRSVVCSTNINYADGYGVPYLVIPIDGASIGVCSNNDFWNSFKYIRRELGVMTMDAFNEQLHPMLDWASGRKYNDENWNSMVSAMKDFDKKIEEKGWDIFYDIFNPYNDPKDKIRKWQNVWKGNLMKTLEDLMNPQKNNFSLTTAGQPIRNKDAEVWIGGQCLLTEPMNEDDLVGLLSGILDK